MKREPYAQLTVLIDSTEPDVAAHKLLTYLGDTATPTDLARAAWWLRSMATELSTLLARDP